MDAEDLSIVAFMDESRKPVRDEAKRRSATDDHHYVVAGAILLHGDGDPLRSAIHELQQSVGRPLHYSDLRRRAREDALLGLAEIPDWDGILFETDRAQPSNSPESRIRHIILNTALPALFVEHGARQVTLETRATPHLGFRQLDQHDHSTFRSLIDRGRVPEGRSIRHDDKSEPLLWVCDLLAGARTDFICGVDRSMYPLIAHRVLRLERISV